MKQAVVQTAALKVASINPPAFKQALTAAPNKGINLSMIGIPQSLQSRTPTELYYPPGFNPQARPHWLGMFGNPVFTDALATHTEAEEAWMFVTTSFMEACHREGIDPFKNRKDASVNNDVRSMLFDRRMKLKRYMDRSKLFAVVKVLPMTARHNYKVLSTGNLQVMASLQFEMEDADALAAYLRTPHMKMLKDGQGYSRNLMRNLVVRVTNIRKKRATIVYTLEIRPPYFVPDTKTTQEQRHQYFDREFFNPMVRGFQFDTLQKRIKF